MEMPNSAKGLVELGEVSKIKSSELAIASNSAKITSFFHRTMIIAKIGGIMEIQSDTTTPNDSFYYFEVLNFLQWQGILSIDDIWQK